MKDIPANDLLDLRLGGFSCAFTFELLDQGWNVIGEMHPQSGATMAMNSTATIQRTVRGLVLPESELQDINIFSDRVLITMRLSDGTSWPMGVFLFTTDVNKISPTEVVLETSLVDQGFILNYPAPNTFGLPEGGSVGKAMEEIVETVGFTRYNISSTTTQVYGGPVIYQPATPAIQILRDLCHRAGFLPPYFDNTGTLILRMADSLDPDAGHRYPLSTESRIISNSYSISTHLLEAPNTYKVISSGGNDTATISATAFVDPNLPHSKENRGFRITEIISVQGLGSTNDCLAVAQSRARSDPKNFTTVEFQSVIDPRHDIFDIIQLGTETFREMSWSTELKSGGLMSHSLNRRTFNANDTFEQEFQ